jgi:flagellar protein FlaJ
MAKKKKNSLNLFKFIKIENRHILFMVVGVSIIVISNLLNDIFTFSLPAILFGIVLFFSPFATDFFVEIRRQKEVEEHFPDFVRNLVGAIKSGMPVSKAIIYVSNSDYGPLNPYVKKMAHQVEWSIPVRKVLLNFSNDIKNPIIKRAISTVIEAEKTGGNIEDVLSSITMSLFTIKKIKEERKSAVQGQITQSYIIFFVFLLVLIVIQNFLIPYISSMDTTSTDIRSGVSITSFQKTVSLDFTSFPRLIGSLSRWFVSMSGIFVMLAMIQAFFAGLVLGKLSEGDIRSGIKHSMIMMLMSIFIITIANAVFNSINVASSSGVISS